MHNAFHLLVFPNSMFTPLFVFFKCQGYVFSGEIALKNNHYYYHSLLDLNHSVISSISKLVAFIMVFVLEFSFRMSVSSA